MFPRSVETVNRSAVSFAAVVLSHRIEINKKL